MLRTIKIKNNILSRDFLSYCDIKVHKYSINKKENTLFYIKTDKEFTF